MKFSPHRIFSWGKYARGGGEELYDAYVRCSKPCKELRADIHRVQMRFLRAANLAARDELNADREMHLITYKFLNVIMQIAEYISVINGDEL